jgi:hypothetical protein
LQRRTRNRLIALTAGVLGVVLGLTLVLASGGNPFATKHSLSASPAPPAPAPPPPITLSKEYIYAGGRLVAIEEPVAANVPPTISITAPAVGSAFVAPASFAITTNAADSDGTVSKVEFFQGATLIGTVTAAPFSFNWTNVAAGAYSLTAKATDDRGGTTTSAAVGINVNNPNPSVNITSPASGTIFNAPASIAISASASVGAGTITKVDFFQGTTLIGTDTSAPFDFTWSNVSAAANYSLTAKATASTGTTATSPAVNVTVNAMPTVSITAPAAGSVFTAPASVTINATAADPDGSVTKVDFYQGTTLVGTDTSTPFSFSWTNVGAGSYSLTAKATDNRGAITTSPGVAITVNNPAPIVSITAPASGSVFTAPATITINASASVAVGTITKVDFFQGTTLIGTDTAAPFSINWSNVAAGTYSLTAKATASTGTVATSAPISVTVNNPAPLVSITIPSPGAIFSAPANIAIGATASVAVGSITKVEFFNGAALLGTVTSSPYTFNWTSVPQGVYSLTARATASTGTVATSAVVNVTVSNAPSVFIIMPSNGVQYVAPAFIAIAANASDSDGTISKVDFYQGTTLLGTSTSSPYFFSWTNVPAGGYSLTAKATDNMGVTATSTPVNVTVHNPPPEIFITLPVSGATYTTPAAIAMGASASVAVGTITKVEFFQGTTLLSTVTSSPYVFQWNFVPVGSYVLTAKATASTGTTRTSAPVNVTVTNGAGGGMAALTDGLPGASGLGSSHDRGNQSTAKAQPSDSAGSSGEIFGNNLTPHLSDRWINYAYDQLQSDCYVRATITKMQDTSATVGLVLRSNPSSEDYYYADYDGGSGAWRIYSNHQGVETELGVWEDPLATGDARTVAFHAVGDNLTLFVDGISRITATDSQITTAGSTGIAMRASNGITGFAVSGFESGSASAWAMSLGDRLLETAQTIFAVLQCSLAV